LIIVATIFAAMLPAPAQAEPRTGVALRAWAAHHLNFLYMIPAAFTEQCGEVSPDVWDWPQNYGSQGLVAAVVIGATRVSLGYDGRGRLVRYDYPGYVTATCAYDEASNLILWTRDVRVEDERLGSVYRATYGPHKQPLQETYDYDVTGDGLTDFRDVLTSSYDSQGRLVVKRFQGDYDADGTLDGSIDYLIAYDAQGRPTSEVEESDLDGNGVVEYRDALFRTWGRQDQVVGVRFETDVNGDGVIDTWSSTDTVLDHKGNVIEQVYNVDYAGRSDGGADGTPESTSVTRSTYDARGNVILSLTDVYNTNPAFVFHWRTEDSYEYDAAGRPTRQESGSDVDLDGVYEDVLIVTVAYDERGRMVEWGTAWEGDPTSGQRERYVFDAQGYLTSVLQEYFDGTQWIGGVWLAFEYL
jgi:YD repeat-containing protein